MAYKGLAIRDAVKITTFYSFFYRHYENTYRFLGETHNFWECVLVRKGEISVAADERIYRLGENEMIFHKPLELHKFNIESPDGADLMIFSFVLEGENAEYFKNKVYKLNDVQRKMAEDTLSFIIAKLDGASGFYSFEDKLKALSTSDISAQLLALKITELFLSLLESNNVSSSFESYEATVFKTAVDYMNNNIHRSISIEELAQVCHLSASSIKRLFKKYTGIGIHSYLIALKMKTATGLLQSGISVTSTAAKLGFSSQGYFSAAYKREMGISPTEVIAQSKSKTEGVSYTLGDDD